MDKDEILTRIVELEKELSTQRTEYAEKKESVSKIEAEKDMLYKAYEEIKAKFDEKVREYKDTKFNLDYLIRAGKQNEDELAKLRREFSRIQDAERIHQEYLDKVNAFRESCLEAPWRKENRSDGLGALNHQIEGAIHLAVAGQALLGDKRGLGKTLTALILCDLKKSKKVIAICPSDTMDNFIREIKLWTPHRSPIKLGKMSKGSRDFLLPQLKSISEFFIVVNYEAWRKDPQLIEDLVALKADTLICDEAHRAKTMSTSTCKGVQDVRFGFNECPGCGFPRISVESDLKTAQCKCGYKAPITEFCSIKTVLPMTGTPILNRPQELFPQLRLIDPNNFTKLNLFLSDYCIKNSNQHWTWQYGAEKEVIQKIGPRYLARDRKAAGVIIPPPSPVDHIITMEELEESYPRQFKAYEQARKYAQIVLDPDKEIAMSMPVFLTVILRLRQVMTWPAAIELKAGDELIAKLEVYESAKIDKAEELIKEITSEGERVVLFSQFREPLRELHRRLGSDSAVYDGSTSSYRRNEIQLDFDPKTAPVNPRWSSVLCNYKAAGEGLNLNAATQMVILDEEWNPGRQEQAYGRIDRLGQTRDTMIHTIRVEPSIDTWMANLIQEKRELIGGFETEANLFQRTYDALRNGEI